MAASRVVVSTPDAPAAIGPYSQAIAAGDTLYVSGQIGLDPATGQFVSEKVEEQADRVMKSLGAILAAGGSNWGSVLKVGWGKLKGEGTVGRRGETGGVKRGLRLELSC
jgi:reactive intermediate/imine deaminase